MTSPHLTKKKYKLFFLLVFNQKVYSNDRKTRHIVTGELVLCKYEIPRMYVNSIKTVYLIYSKNKIHYNIEMQLHK